MTADHRDKSSSPVTTIAALNIHDREISGLELFRVCVCVYLCSKLFPNSLFEKLLQLLPLRTNRTGLWQ